MDKLRCLLRVLMRTPTILSSASFWRGNQVDGLPRRHTFFVMGPLSLLTTKNVPKRSHCDGFTSAPKPQFPCWLIYLENLLLCVDVRGQNVALEAANWLCQSDKEDDSISPNLKPEAPCRQIYQEILLLCGDVREYISERCGKLCGSL